MKTFNEHASSYLQMINLNDGICICLVFFFSLSPSGTEQTRSLWEETLQYFSNTDTGITVFAEQPTWDEIGFLPLVLHSFHTSTFLSWQLVWTPWYPLKGQQWTGFKVQIDWTLRGVPWPHAWAVRITASSPTGNGALPLSLYRCV